MVHVKLSIAFVVAAAAIAPVVAQPIRQIFARQSSGDDLKVHEPTGQSAAHHHSHVFDKGHHHHPALHEGHAPAFPTNLHHVLSHSEKPQTVPPVASPVDPSLLSSSKHSSVRLVSREFIDAQDFLERSLEDLEFEAREFEDFELDAREFEDEFYLD